MTKSLPPKTLVLYADDDADDIELVADAFREHARNVQLITFNDGMELMQYVSSIEKLEPAPCLFILDINMPRLNGKETLRRLRQLQAFAEIPAVLFSTSTMPADESFAANYNAGFVTKPLLADQIHHIIDQIIEHCSDEVKERIKKRN